MNNGDFWMTVMDRDGQEAQPKRFGAMRVALLFGTAAIAIAAILTPIAADRTSSARIAWSRTSSTTSPPDQFRRARKPRPTLSANRSCRTTRERSASLEATAASRVTVEKTDPGNSSGNGIQP